MSCMHLLVYLSLKDLEGSLEIFRVENIPIQRTTQVSIFERRQLFFIGREKTSGLLQKYTRERIGAGRMSFPSHHIT